MYVAIVERKEKDMENKVDEGLSGNEKIEEAIAALQQEPTQELLAHVLTVIRGECGKMAS